MKPYIVLVDTYAPSSLQLPVVFERAGYTPIRVQSTRDVPKALHGKTDPYPYERSIVHRGSLTETVDALKPFEPVAVIPGCEHGVELADALSDAFAPLTGAPSNGTALSSARRNKFDMIERIKAKGLRGAEQILVKSEEQLRDWHGKLARKVIVKPLRSAGNDGVLWCATPDDSVRAFRRLTGRDNIVGEIDGVVAQEYLVGAEYLVNTVSRDGRHHVCDIWKTHRMSANGVDDLLVACQILPRTGEVQDSLVPYALEVLDALGIRHGAGHVEIKMTPDGPCLIEVGARLAGAGLPGLAEFAIGESQTEWMVDAYVRPERFHERCGQPYRLQRSVAWALMVAPRSGRLVSYRGLDTVEKLDSFLDMRLRVKPGEQLHRTVDDGTYPVSLTLAHEVDEVLLRDLMTLRYLDGESFYEVAASPSSPDRRTTRHPAHRTIAGFPGTTPLTTVKA